MKECDNIHYYMQNSPPDSSPENGISPNQFICAFRLWNMPSQLYVLINWYRYLVNNTTNNVY